MDDRVVKFRVGVMVISTILIAGILVVMFGDARSWVIGKYQVHIHFNDAPGVTEGTPVRKNGILIGRVRDVEFAPQGGVNVTVEIHQHVKLYRNEVPQVSGSLLGGDVVIQFVKRTRPSSLVRPPPGTPGNSPGAPSEQPPESKTGDQGAQPPATSAAAAPQAPADSPDQLIQPDDYIEGSVAPSPVQVITNLEGNLTTAIDSLSNAGTEVGKLAARLNVLLDENDDQLKRVVDSAEKTLSSFQQALANFDDVIGDENVRENLRKSIEELPRLLTDTRGTMNSMRTTVESVDRNMRNLEGFTGPLGDRGEQIVMRVDRAIASLDGLLGELSDFGKKLNSGQGSLGRIMSDPDLYQNLNKAALNIAQITCELRPVVNDARVFADKIARHPELLGVRGALQRSPGTK